MTLHPSVVIALIAAAVSGCASSPTPPPVEQASVQPPPNSAVRALEEIEVLRRELASLRNEMEIQRHETEKLTTRQRELYDDLDYRLRQAERGTGGAPPSGFGAAPSYTAPTDRVQQPGQIVGQPPVESPGQAPGSVDPRSLQTGAEPVQPAAAAPSTMPSGGPIQQQTVATAGEQGAYDGAFELLKQSRYAEAIDGFRRVVNQFPDGALADDAQYWVGEALYVTRDFDDALTAFERMLASYPDSPRVPEAMLKVGYIQYEKGLKQDAWRTLSDVVNRFPGSRVAISAQTRLRKIEQEGG